ncbi:MAG: YbbR-like domain-containing protein [Muribaculaceae bacterium]|nr:YbbR-like domain-containing protein [Muribaculaceae bacterium]
MIKRIGQKFENIRATSRGRNILTYFVFVLIAASFWVLTMLNDEVQRNYIVPIEFTNMPENVTLLHQGDVTASVIVRNKGRSLVRYDWGISPTLRLNFADFKSADNNKLEISEQLLLNLLRNRFGSTSEIVSVRPDSIVVNYTTRPGDKLPVVVNVDALSAPQYIVHGALGLSSDSVTVYSRKGLPSRIISINTEKISLRGLTDSTTIEVPLEAPAGALVVPPTIKVTIPVQPLISKKRTVPVKARNVPYGSKMLIFPPNVEVSYLLPMNMYNDDYEAPTASVDYRDTHSGENKVPVTVGNIPDFYRGVSVNHTEVEYIIEH